MILTKIRKIRQKCPFRYLEKGALELHRAAMTKLRQIERSDFFYWTTTDKLKFTNWSQVNWMSGCGENVNFR